jgi:hypothetical protein
MAGGSPLSTNTMSHKLGAEWAASLLGFIAVAQVPIPIVFYVFGKRIRGRWKSSQKIDHVECYLFFPLGVEALPSRSANNHR